MHHLKQYFAAHKKHGSTDRRTIAHLCYTYYRLGASIKEFDADKGLQLAIFLCEAKPGNWALLFEPSWLAVWNSSDVSSDVSLEQKLDFIKEVYPGYNPASIFLLRRICLLAWMPLPLTGATSFNQIYLFVSGQNKRLLLWVN